MGTYWNVNSDAVVVSSYLKSIKIETKWNINKD